MGAGWGGRCCTWGHGWVGRCCVEVVDALCHAVLCAACCVLCCCCVLKSGLLHTPHKHLSCAVHIRMGI